MTYDGFNRVSTLTSPYGANLSFSYTGFLPTLYTWSGAVQGSVSFDYNSNLQLSHLSAGGSATSFTYGKDGNLKTAGAETLSYHAQNGYFLGSSISNTVDSYTYNTFGEWDTYGATTNGSSVYYAVFGRDLMGRITSKTETVDGITSTYVYVYDDAGRITDVSKNGVAVSQYGYDGNSNRTSATLQGSSVTGTVDNQDKLLTYGNLTYTYNNNNGELLTKTYTPTPQVTTFTHDANGNLISVSLSNSTVVSYVVDGNNRRAGRKVNNVLLQVFLYQSQLQVVAELNGAGTLVSRFVYGSKSNVPDYMIKSGTTYRIISDHLGSPRVVLNASTGVVMQRLDYDEFGRITLDTNPGFQPFGFAGGLYDQDTKMVKFGARDYDPEAGRWASKDPILFTAADTNLYGYTFNDPVNLIDPSGNCPWCVGAVAVAGAVSAGTTAYLAGGTTKEIGIAAAVGLFTGAGSAMVSAFTSSAAGIVAANATIGFGANVATQVGTGVPLGHVNITSAVIGGVAGGVGGAAGLAAGNLAFFNTGVIGNPVGVALARSREYWAATLTGAAVGTATEASANACRSSND